MQRDDYRATLLIIIGLATANLTGLVRQAALAHQLGAGHAADIYLIAFALPEFAFLALPIVLLPAFLPLFARRRIERGEADAWRFGLRVAALLLATLALPAIAEEYYRGHGNRREHWHGDIRHFHDHDIARWREGRWIHGLHEGRHGGGGM